MAMGIAMSTPSAHQGHLHTRLMSHKKCYSYGFDSGAVKHDNINEIGALSAGLLPLLFSVSMMIQRRRRSIVKPTYEFGAIKGIKTTLDILRVV
ncbi:hypothetical protein OF83DRAFT_1177349 [Amylostereum chailletii]|nr:hypothetical protein OF83DRAFT_1177349 [Amylostereum chailletii]